MLVPLTFGPRLGTIKFMATRSAVCDRLPSGTGGSMLRNTGSEKGALKVRDIKPHAVVQFNIYRY